MKLTALYLCYQSLLEPLTQTQVVNYLEGLAGSGYGIVLLTFEPRPLSRSEADVWRERMARKGITWYWRRYHKWPTVPATAWDILVGVLTGLRLIRQHGVTLLHARAHVPGVMGLALKWLTGVKLLFDVRGLLAEEYADAGVWNEGGTLFHVTKQVERMLVHHSNGVVVLAERAKALLQEWYPREIDGKPLVVIPCCVDLRNTPPDSGPFSDCVERRSETTLVYVGKLGGWYLVEPMVAFVAAARRVIPGLSWDVWTQSSSESLEQIVCEAGLEDCVSVARTTPEELPLKLSQADAALCFIKPCLSKMASSPTKLGEYLAAGLPVVCTAGIGDVDAILNTGVGDGRPVGVLIRDFDDVAYLNAIEGLQRLLRDPETPSRCRAVAETRFDLERVGWTRYRDLYEILIGRPSTALVNMRSFDNSSCVSYSNS
jgi:glycosyltransferase involved in cell wall biosynthesis